MVGTEAVNERNFDAMQIPSENSIEIADEELVNSKRGVMTLSLHEGNTES